MRKEKKTLENGIRLVDHSVNTKPVYKEGEGVVALGPTYISSQY